MTTGKTLPGTLQLLSNYIPITRHMDGYMRRYKFANIGSYTGTDIRVIFVKTIVREIYEKSCRTDIGKRSRRILSVT